MKFNTTYNPQISLEKTIVEIDNFKKEIISFLSKKFNLKEVLPPLISKENDLQNIDMKLVTRSISFDIGSTDTIAKNYLSLTNWSRQLLNKLDVSYNDGIWFNSSTIWRDLPENTNTTIVKNELNVVAKISKENLEERLLFTTNDLYTLIQSLANKIEEKYKIKNIYPEVIEYVSAQDLETEFPNMSFKERENQTILNHEAFVLKNPGSKLFSGQIHTQLPKGVYDLEKYNQIVLKDRINVEKLKVASVGILSSGKQLSDQLTLYGLADLAAEKFYANWIKNDTKFLEIKINISRLALALLAKAHIAEVQPGVLTDEADVIESRHNIEIY